MHSNVIYKYSCSGCNATYYGKTARNLKVCCCEHLGITKSVETCAPASTSSIWDHIKQTGHIGKLEDFSIISRTRTLEHTRVGKRSLYLNKKERRLGDLYINCNLRSG